jgi:hypothetical protein
LGGGPPGGGRRAVPGATCGAIALAGCVAGCLGLATARADDDFAGASVIFARGNSLFRVDARGKDETEIAKLAGDATVRALRCDAAGTVLLADLDGRWAWMPLDGSTRTLTELPCGDGPAQLSADGSSVLCRSTRAAHQSVLVALEPGTKQDLKSASVALDVPPGGARLAGVGAEARLVWADTAGVWTASPSDPKKRARVAPDPPLRGFLPSPDGTRAIGVYSDQIYDDARRAVPAEVLMTLQLDNQGARRKAIRSGVAVEWSHDSQWVLVQDSARTCIMRAAGGQYKCWRGYTAASLSSDGRWALAFGNRDGRKPPPAKSRRKKADKKADKKSARREPEPAPEPIRSSPEPGEMPWDHIDEPSDEPETRDAAPDDAVHPSNDDVSVPPPTGPQSLYRLRLEGAFTDRPTLLVKNVDGAAVWVPRSR